jgi:hypothetical protein
MQSRYCKARGLSRDTVATVVKEALLRAERGMSAPLELIKGDNVPNRAIQAAALKSARG